METAARASGTKIVSRRFIDYAHQAGVVHRDLKPENIMVPYKSRSEKTYDLKNSKLMDLGLARSERQRRQQQRPTAERLAIRAERRTARPPALDAPHPPGFRRRVAARTSHPPPDDNR